MNQSNIIFAYLFLAFVVFITVRGELATYLGFFGVGGQGKGGNLPAATTSAGGVSGALGTLATVAGGQLGGQLAGVLGGGLGSSVADGASAGVADAFSGIGTAG